MLKWTWGPGIYIFINRLGDPAHLDDFVNVLCVLCTTMVSYENGFVSILLWLVYGTQSIEVRNRCEISLLL